MEFGQVDWKQVEKRLRCPKCGDKAHIDSGTDGTQASHTHTFELSREEALRLSRPTLEEAQIRITELEAELSQMRRIVDEATSSPNDT